MTLRELMRAAFPSACYAFVSGPLNQKIEVAGLDLLLLDLSVHRKPHGELEGPTLHWLDGMLASSPARPALLFLHHPPFKAGIWHMDRQNLLNAGDLAPIVRRHPRVQLIATGHVHRAALTMFRRVCRPRSARPRTMPSISIWPNCANPPSRSSRRLSISIPGFQARGSAPSLPIRSPSAPSTARIRSLGRMESCCNAARPPADRL